MPKIYLGDLSAIEYIGETQKEFTRAPFVPKPIVTKGDIVVLEKINAYNISKLLPTEWKMWDKNFIEVREDDELLEIIAEYDSHLEELEAVVAAHDLKEITSEEIENLNENIIVPNISPDEALEKTFLKPLEEFSNKEELEAYALEEFSLELDRRLSLENMYKTLVEITESKEK